MYMNACFCTFLCMFLMNQQPGSRVADADGTYDL